MRHLILFDIDGTLVTGGPAKAAFRAAMLEVYGTTGPIADYGFSGKTDPQIARGLLDAVGMDHGQIEAGFPALWAAYLTELEHRLPQAPMRLLDGVVELVSALEGEVDAALGLVTGNIVDGARLKLGSVGFSLGPQGHFPIGGYGSDAEIRDHLPGIALERARGNWDVDFPRERVWVVGDTPLDVQCGRYHGVRTLAVATGNFSVAELESAGADVVLQNFQEPERTVELLLEA